MNKIWRHVSNMTCKHNIAETISDELESKLTLLNFALESQQKTCPGLKNYFHSHFNAGSTNLKIQVEIEYALLEYAPVYNCILGLSV